MEINFITKSTKENNSCSSLGEKINDLLNSRNPFYNKVWFIFGVSRESGLLYIKESLQESRENGSTVNFVLSIDSNNTTQNYLNNLITTGSNVWISNNNKTAFIHNPRICIFEAENSKVEVLFTSADFTEEGLSTNFETTFNITFDIAEKKYIELKKSINQYLAPNKKIFKLLSSQVIEKLKANNELMSDKLDSITKLPSINEVRKGYRKNPDIEDAQDIQDAIANQGITKSNLTSKEIVIDTVNDQMLEDDIIIDFSSNIKLYDEGSGE